MTNRIQVLRSSTPGQVPTAGTRQPGELWTTFPDKQLGIIDASKTAQPMIAVRFFSTAANYASGDFVVQAGGIWVAKASITAGAFNPVQWSELAYLTDIPALYVLPVASTSVLGGVKIDGTTITIASGVISSAGLVTVSSVAPSPVQNGALWYDLVGGQLYTWVNDGSSSQWVIAVNQNLAGGVWLPLTGGVLSGAISGPSATFDNLSAPQAIGDNRIVNGDMRIDQRNNGASGTATGYTVDRWGFVGSVAGKFTWSRVNAAPNGLVPYGFGNALLFQSASAYASAAGDSFQCYQQIEADLVSDFAWGTASAQPVTLSFWFNSTLSGTFGGSIGNYAATRSYPFTFSYSGGGVWTKIVVTIPGDTGGAWVMSGNSGAMALHFDLGVGSTYRGPAGAWSSNNYVGANGAVSVVGTNGATFFLTGVKLETGSVATPFNRQSLAKSLADCQRYYQFESVAFSVGFNSWGAGGYTLFPLSFPATMRATPTIGLGGSSGVTNVTTATVSAPSPSRFYVNVGAIAAGGTAITIAGFGANAEL